MLDKMKIFSKRLGYSSKEAEIIIREDAPDFLRNFVINQAIKEEVSINILLEIVCDILHKAKQGNWGHEYIKIEVSFHINYCELYKVYDIAEKIYSYLKKNDFHNKHDSYAEKYNELCSERGVGWQFQDGYIVARGTEIEEKISTLLLEQVSWEIYPTAKNELHEALMDISRRPTPDLTGSVQHAFAALECVVREITGSKSETLGKIIKNHRTLFPKPLDEVIEKVWGYASQKGRHLNEGWTPSFREAMLILGLSNSFIAFFKDPIDEVI